MEMMNYKDFSLLTSDEQIDYLFTLNESDMKNYLNKIIKKKNNMLYIKLSSKTKGRKQSNSIISPHLKSENEKIVSNSKLLDLPLEKLKRNPFQPRKFFNNDEIIELAESIKKNGLIQRIIVTQIDEEFIIIVGERRFRAFEMLAKENSKFNKIKVELVELNSQEMLAEWADVENNIRVDLTVIELAERLQFWKSRGYSTIEASKKMGISSSKAGRLSKIAEFSEDIKTKIYEYQINSDHMLEQIAKIDNTQSQLALLTKISDGLRLEELKKEVSKILLPKSQEKSKNINNPFSQIIKWSNQVNNMYKKLDFEKKEKIDEKLKSIEKIRSEINHLIKE